jgi:hypothetical protein
VTGAAFASLSAERARIRVPRARLFLAQQSTTQEATGAGSVQGTGQHEVPGYKVLRSSEGERGKNALQGCSTTRWISDAPGSAQGIGAARREDDASVEANWSSRLPPWYSMKSTSIFSSDFLFGVHWEAGATTRGKHPSSKGSSSARAPAGSGCGGNPALTTCIQDPCPYSDEWNRVLRTSALLVSELHSSCLQQESRSRAWSTDASRGSWRCCLSESM